jgi:methionyl-tRNA formyltransferase
MSRLKIGLFCARDVGLEVARLVAARGNEIHCGIVDDDDPAENRAELCRLWAHIPILTHRELSDAKKRDEFRRLDLDLAILAWWPHLIPQKLAQAPRMGCLNFHPSLLPHNRGKHPNFWSLVEERPYGVSLHFLGPRIDGGDIAFQRQVPTSWEDTGGTLHRKAKRALVDLFADNLERIWAGDIPRRPQDVSHGSFHLAAELDPASQIDLDAPTTARRLLNLLRARTYRPHPGAFFHDGSATYDVRIEIRARHENGSIADQREAGAAEPFEEVAK